MRGEKRMKEIYTSVEMEIVHFEAEDIITTSACPNELPGMEMGSSF